MCPISKLEFVPMFIFWKIDPQEKREKEEGGKTGKREKEVRPEGVE